MDINSSTLAPDLLASTSKAVLINFHNIDYVVFGALLMVSMAIGVYFGYFSKSEQTTEEYLLGGRKMKTIPIAISLIASQMSAMTIIGVPADAYGFGSAYMVSIAPIMVLATVFVQYAILPVFYNNNIDNCYTYLELRFNKKVKDLITGLFFLTVLVALPIASFFPALAFAQVSGQNIHVVNSVVGMICVLYTMMGGIKAVVWTDVLQGSVMVFSITVVFVYAVLKVGGFEIIMSRAIDGGRLGDTSWVLDLTTRQTMWNTVIGTFPLWVGHIGLSQSCVQRIVALPSLGHAKRALVLVCIGIIAITVVNCFVGVIMYAYYFDCDPVKAGAVSRIDKLIPYFVNDIVGHISGMPGLFISCVFSASLSTVSAYLNSIAGLIYKDYVCKIRGFKHTESKASLIMKSIVVVVGVYSVLMGFLLERSSSLFQVSFTLSGLTKGVVFGVFTLGMFYPKANHRVVLMASTITLLFMAWVVIGGQVYRELHNISYHLLPTTIEGCDARNVTISLNPKTLITSLPQDKAANTFYNISFSWYAAIGVLVVWLVTVVLCEVIGTTDEDRPIDPNLISPVAQFMVPKKHRHIQMQELNASDIKMIESERPFTETEYVVR